MSFAVSGHYLSLCFSAGCLEGLPTGFFVYSHSLTLSPSRIPQLRLFFLHFHAILTALLEDYPLTYGSKMIIHIHPALHHASFSLSMKKVHKGGLSLADVSLNSAMAGFAGDVTAPVIFTLAALHQHLCIGIIPSSTTHESTALTTGRSLVTLPAERIQSKLFTRNVFLMLANSVFAMWESVFVSLCVW